MCLTIWHDLEPESDFVKVYLGTEVNRDYEIGRLEITNFILLMVILALLD